MKRRNKRTKILFIVIVIIIPFLIATHNDSLAPVQNPVKKKNTQTNLPANPYMNKVLDEYEASMEQIMKKTGIPGAAITIVQDTTTLYMKGLGVKAINTYDSIDENTVFRLGSVSKCFASVLTAELVHEHILEWNDPVVQYLPDFKLKSDEQTQCLTISNVLSHTTGLPYHTYTTLIEDGIDLKTMISKLANINCGKVGEVYSYQNVAYSLIGEVVQSATGKTYEEMLAEKIFKPLHMKNASCTYDDIIYNDNVAQPHLIKRRHWKQIPISDKYYNVTPAGGINASIADMNKWIKALLGNNPDVITQESLDKIFEPFISAGSKNRSYRKVDHINETFYALGWRVIHFPHDTIVYHGGYVNGYRSEVAIHPKDKIAICILSNAPGSLTDNGIPIFLKLYFAHREIIKQWENERHYNPPVATAK